MEKIMDNEIKPKTDQSLSEIEDISTETEYEDRIKDLIAISDNIKLEITELNIKAQVIEYTDGVIVKAEADIKKYANIPLVGITLINLINWADNRRYIITHKAELVNSESKVGSYFDVKKVK
jgi:hypothetical protein